MAELCDKDLEEMAHLFNDSIRIASVSEEWLHSYLRPLPKPGKDHTQLNGYRMITLQNTLRKILEKIIANKLQNDLE